MAKTKSIRIKPPLYVVSTLVLSVAVLNSFAAPRSRGAEKSPRARPPDWSQDVQDTFFEDAREVLVGERPDFGAGDRGQGSEVSGRGSEASPVTKPAGFRWSSVISSETIEDEIKRTQRRLAEHVKTPSAFKGGGYTECRRHFSKLAVLFAVAAEYDSDVRWKSNAAGLRDLFARAGFNCKVGSDGAYNEARLRAQDLEDLVRGGRVETPDAEPPAVWTEIADRPPLMETLEWVHEKRLDPLLASATEFRKKRDEVVHEAEMLTLLAEIIAREDYEYFDDEDFVSYCNVLRDAARAVVRAVGLKDYEQARKAAGRASNACSECHEGYRS